jgi:hypothetical protein
VDVQERCERLAILLLGKQENLKPDSLNIENTDKHTKTTCKMFSQ